MAPTNFTIHCTHPDYIVRELSFDFGELCSGASSTVHGRGAKKWQGGYVGRPQLAAQFFPILQVVLYRKRPSHIRGILSVLRQFFRFLDGYEAWCATQEKSAAAYTVNTVSDITPHHLMCWSLSMPGSHWNPGDPTARQRFAQLLILVRSNLGLPSMWIPASQKKEDTVRPPEIPNEEVGKALVRELARLANEIWKRWKRADLLASQGRNLFQIKRTPPERGGCPTFQGITEADVHTTYRLFVDQCEGVPPTMGVFLEALGCSSDGLPRWWPVYSEDHSSSGSVIPYWDLQDGLYPSADDISVLVLLFMSRTGWNPAVVAAIDVTYENSWYAQYSEKLVWMFAFKDRANAWQDTLCWAHKRTGPYQIVKRLLERLAPLRKAVMTSPTLCPMPDLAIRSPWLYTRTNQPGGHPIRVFEPEMRNLKEVLPRVINNYNYRQPSTKGYLPDSIRPGDLRDIFAGAIYRKTGYSLVLTQMALGHKSARTTFRYLRSRAWREESERTKNALIVAVFDRIEVHRRLDLTLLRAQMDGVQITQEDIDRLEAYRRNRTYSGTGCSDPTHPPSYIDPTNPRDGTTACAQGHRCAGCPKGRVFSDSLPGLARRCAELEWLRDTLPAVVFETSSERDDLEVLQATLKQWKTAEVSANVSYWTGEIASGRHHPIRFGGEH